MKVKTNQEIKALAYQKVQGKRGIFIVAFLVMIAISGLSAIPGIGAVASLLLTGPLTLGLAIVSLKVVRKQETDIPDVFEGFKNFLNSFVTYLLEAVYLFLWGLLIIPAFIKPFSYSMAFYILADNPGMSGNDAITLSRKMMDGYKWKLFCLHFSFIGWHILAMLTCGILYLWLAPYIQASVAEFYKDINRRNEKEENEFAIEYAEIKNEEKCPLCGTLNDADSKFCSRCGEKLKD